MLPDILHSPQGAAFSLPEILEKLDNHYLLHIKYDKDDEPEMVIRVLSFGPTVEVTEPDSFKKAIIDKLKNINEI